MKGSQLFERERSLKPPPLPSNVILNLPKKKIPLTSRDDEVLKSVEEGNNNSNVNFDERNGETSSLEARGFDKENFNPSASSSSFEKTLHIEGQKSLQGKAVDIACENDKSPERITPNTSAAKAKVLTDIVEPNQGSAEGYLGKEDDSRDNDTTVPSSSSVHDAQATKKTDFRTLDFFDSTVGNLPLILSDSNESDHKFEIDETMKILIVGNAKCGKSSIIARYAMNSFHENYKTTIGADFVRKDLSLQLQDGEQLGVRLQLWDIAGQDRFQKMTRAYFAKARGVVIVCDVSREGTVDAIKNWKREIDHWANVNSGDRALHIPVILFANKADLLTNAQEAFKTGATMERICREQGIMNWWSTSARTGEYVDDGFALLISHILEADKRNRVVQERESAIHSLSYNNSSTASISRIGQQYHFDSPDGAFKIGRGEGAREGKSPRTSWMTQPSGVCW